MSGEHGTLLMTTQRKTVEELTSKIEEADAFACPLFQIDDGAIAYSYSGDPVSVAVSIYTASLAEALLPADAEQRGRFQSKGERVFLGSLMSLAFEEWSPSFFLRPGSYALHILGWNLAFGCADASPTIDDLLSYQRHAVVFRA
jgi:hypothetical protein